MFWARCACRVYNVGLMEVQIGHWPFLFAIALRDISPREPLVCAFPPSYWAALSSGDLYPSPSHPSTPAPETPAPPRQLAKLSLPPPPPSLPTPPVEVEGPAPNAAVAITAAIVPPPNRWSGALFMGHGGHPPLPLEATVLGVCGAYIRQDETMALGARFARAIPLPWTLQCLHYTSGDDLQAHLLAHCVDWDARILRFLPPAAADASQVIDLSKKSHVTSRRLQPVFVPYAVLPTPHPPCW